METKKVAVGLVIKDGKPVACIIYDEKKHAPITYSLEQLSFDGMVELLDVEQNKSIKEEGAGKIFDGTDDDEETL